MSADREAGLPLNLVQPGAAPVVEVYPPPAEALGGNDDADPGGSPLDRPGFKRFIGYQVMSEFVLTGGIWILYLQHLGFSLGQIGLAEAMFHLAPITLELPSGSLADVVGRKWSLAIGSVLVALSALLMLRADSIWWVLAAMYISGASYAFRSGAAQAMLYDSLAEGQHSSRFSGIWGRLLSASYVVFAAATWVGSALAGRDFRLAYALEVAIALGAVWLAIGLREPARDLGQRLGMVATVREAVRIVRGRRRLIGLLVFGAGIYTLSTLIGLYSQAVLSSYGLGPAQVGLVIGVTFFFTAIGAWFSERLGGRLRFSSLLVVATAVVVVAGLGMGSGILFVACGFWLISEIVVGVFEPLLAAEVNEGLPAAQRATILSVESLLFSITMIWAFPLFGVAAERAGWFAAYAAAGAVVIVLCIVWFAIGRDPEPAIP